MQVSEKGLNQGEAKVYFADYKSSADFYAFARKLKLEERALKAVMIRDEKFK